MENSVNGGERVKRFVLLCMICGDQNMLCNAVNCKISDCIVSMYLRHCLRQNLSSQKSSKTLMQIMRNCMLSIAVWT